MADDDQVTDQDTDLVGESLAKGVLEGTNKTTSPFDSLYGEEAPKFGDAATQDWVSKQKDGAGFEKGLAGLRKMATGKGLERPGEGATEEETAAFAAQLRTLNGIPESSDDYKLTFDESWNLGEETQKAMIAYGHENGIPPAAVEKMLPFQAQLTEQIAKDHLAAQEVAADKLFGGEGEFDKVAEGLHKYLDAKGYDFDDPAFRNAQAWKMVQDLQAAEARISELTGEGGPIHGDTGGNNGNEAREALETRQSELLFGDTPDAADFKNPGMGQRHVDLRNEFLDIGKKLTAIAKRS